MKKLIVLFVGLLLFGSCAPRYATCPTYAKNEVLQKKENVHIQPVKEESGRSSMTK